MVSGAYPLAANTIFSEPSRRQGRHRLSLLFVMMLTQGTWGSFLCLSVFLSPLSLVVFVCLSICLPVCLLSYMLGLFVWVCLSHLCLFVWQSECRLLAVFVGLSVIYFIFFFFNSIFLSFFLFFVSFFLSSFFLLSLFFSLFSFFIYLCLFLSIYLGHTYLSIYFSFCTNGLVAQW